MFLPNSKAHLRTKLLSNMFDLFVGALYLDLGSKSQSSIVRYLVHQTLNGAAHSLMFFKIKTYTK